LSKTLDLENFATARRSSQRVVNLAPQTRTFIEVNWTVVGRTKLTAFATVYGQFITSTVHLCLQHNVREAARRAGPFATADTLFITIGHRVVGEYTVLLADRTTGVLTNGRFSWNLEE